MRYSAVLVAGVAGLASQASAQNFSLALVPSATTVNEGGTFTLSVYGDADAGSHLLGGAFSLESNSACIVDMSWQNASWSAFNTDGGYAGNGNYNQVIFGQLVIPGIFPPAAGSELGGLIGSFSVTVSTGGDGPLFFQLIAGSPFTLETVDSVSGTTYQSSSGAISLGSATVFACIPSPGTLAILGLGGLASARRRR